MAAKKPRLRLSPEVRRDQILDEAARLVVKEGVSALTMERLGREAGISKALVYAYYPTAADLLRSLLLREYELFQAKAQQLLREAENLDKTIEIVVGIFIDQVSDRSTLIHRLTNEPEIASALRGINQRGRQVIARYLTRQTGLEYNIGDKQAAILAEIVIGIARAAGDHVHRGNRDVDAVRSLTVRMIKAALGDGARKFNPVKAANRRS
jgi:AcrR family transcriptional regulator